MAIRGVPSHRQSDLLEAAQAERNENLADHSRARPQKQH